MTRIIFCQKLHKEAEGLVAQPYPGEFGKRIYENISQEAWQLWIEHQTRLINEYRLNLMEVKSRQFLAQEMEKFLFSDSSTPPPGFVPPASENSA